jgi:hypothetical protein
MSAKAHGAKQSSEPLDLRNVVELQLKVAAICQSFGIAEDFLWTLAEVQAAEPIRRPLHLGPLPRSDRAKRQNQRRAFSLCRGNRIKERLNRRSATRQHLPQ